MTIKQLIDNLKGVADQFGSEMESRRTVIYRELQRER